MWGNLRWHDLWRLTEGLEVVMFEKPPKGGHVFAKPSHRSKIENSGTQEACVLSFSLVLYLFLQKHFNLTVSLNGSMCLQAWKISQPFQPFRQQAPRLAQASAPLKMLCQHQKEIIYKTVTSLPTSTKLNLSTSRIMHVSTCFFSPGNRKTEKQYRIHQNSGMLLRG